MSRKSSIVGRRKAWGILQLALTQAKNRLIISSHMVRKGIKRFCLCIKPHADFDYQFESDDEEEEEEMSGSCEDDEEIDLKAEQFIAKFYEQLKLQRQISYLQYNEKAEQSL